jgi:adenylosuccinate synthase
MKVYCVIGAGYGDEGKGMWVDYRARTSENPLVIRANSGAQVGHTVIRDGKRRIFSHLGSGTLAGAPTLFTRYSVVNPMLFIKEISGRNAHIPFQLFVELDTPVSTPYDMLLNQVMEIRRGNSRHGSCGAGFGVTLEREEQRVPLHFSDLTSMTLIDRIKRVRNWCRNQLGDPQDDDTKFVKQVYEYFSENEMLERFTMDCKVFAARATTWHPDRLSWDDYDTLIFENGQGLLLDQEYGSFPHVTRSNTGFRNIGKVLKRFNLFNEVPVTVDYLTRCYTTRHGAGPLPYERNKPAGIDVDDPTNIFNEYQQNLRFAPLNLYAINEAIEWDKKSHPPNTAINRVVTCCDQIVGDVWNNPTSKEGEAHVVEYVTGSGAPRFLTAPVFMGFIRSEFNVTVGSPEGPQ